MKKNTRKLELEGMLMGKKFATNKKAMENNFQLNDFLKKIKETMEYDRLKIISR